MKRRLQAGLINSVEEQLTVKNVKAFLLKKHSSARSERSEQSKHAGEVFWVRYVQRCEHSQITSISDNNFVAALSLPDHFVTGSDNDLITYSGYCIFVWFLWDSCWGNFQRTSDGDDGESDSARRD